MHLRAALLALCLPPFLAGCKDAGKENAKKAEGDLALLTKVVDADVQEVVRGLPEGAERLAAAFVKDDSLPKDPIALKDALVRVRRQVPDLDHAKSTFFAALDDKGVALRNDLDPDAMAGTNLLPLFPSLSRALAGERVTAVGAFPAPPGTPPERDWVSAVPLRGEGGKLLGLYMTGWTYRRFARHLQAQLKSDMVEQYRKAGDPKLPIFYVAVFDATGTYASPETPPVDEKALGALDLAGKTAAGVASGSLDIEGRTFGWGASRVASINGDDGKALAGVAVLHSEL